MLALLCAALVLLPGDTRLADRVELTDGTVLQGRVVYEDAKGLVLRVGTRDREIARKDVKSSYYRADNQRAAIERWIGLGPVDYRGTLDLAQFCKRHDLLEEMRLFAWWVLLAEPENEEAHEYLGHRKVKNGWLVREGARQIDFEKVVASHTDWGDPWQLETTHYVTRTNLPLRQAIAAALDLECHYRAFLMTFGTDLRLFEVVEPLRANIHADAKSFARLATGRVAYFNPDARALEVDASRGVEVADLCHEATHALVFATAIGTRAARGDIPAWLDEGLAEYMAAGLDGSAGRLEFAKEAMFRTHFLVHARAKKPYDLSRLLNFENADFMASARADLKYAQAYTLVHFGLHGQDGALRTKFLDYVRSAYRGQSSQTHFTDALGLDDQKIERAWLAYVKTVAGG